ncbi:immunoglobulin superfamily member 5 isoform X2 [Dicentrarchus labrax]|uniref:immunoglobulin superfamily member 5 isoform X2 n=1 Tax=Dicentrarchus labrax TaxID=13489 RepID=UPI0021F64862|nr:immunoglobulin superfamily member 5 isoform X2 [Dicentrarchus labrax]
MAVSWKSLPNLLCICLLLCATGVVSQKFQLEPLNATALKGSDVQFNATVEGVWQVMAWSVGGLLVLTVSSTGDITSSSLKQYSARLCSSGDSRCVEFTIHNVTRRYSGPVTCTVQGEYGSKTAHLSVQESGTVNIMEGNVTVMQDEQVEFRCITSAWFPIPTVSWTQNGQAVNSNLYNTTSMVDGDSFNSTSVLNFQAVRNTTVECWATVPTLTNPQSSSVLLVVVPKPPDWTVLIAVVVSFTSFALLVLLIIGIIFCYKRRKEKQRNYQDEMRRVRTQSQISGVSAAGQRQGQVNTGYVPDGQTSVTDSGFSQINGSNTFEMPNAVNSNHAGNAYITVDESGVRKHRHVTIV